MTDPPDPKWAEVYAKVEELKAVAYRYDLIGIRIGRLLEAASARTGVEIGGLDSLDAMERLTRLMTILTEEIEEAQLPRGPDL